MGTHELLPAEFVEFVKGAVSGSVRPLGGVYYLAPNSAGAKIALEFLRTRGLVAQRDYFMTMDTDHVNGLGGSYVHAGTGYHMTKNFGRFLIIRDPAHARAFATLFAGLKPVSGNEINDAKNGRLGAVPERPLLIEP